MRKAALIMLLSLVLLGLCVAAGLAQTAAVEPARDKVAGVPEGYRLQTEDAMRITVWGEPNFSSEQVVDPSGFIHITHMDPIKAEGRTISEMTDSIRAGLLKYLRDPKIKIEMVRFRKPKVYVLGFVHRAGVYEIKEGDRIMDAVALAGSYNEDADLENAKLTRGNKEIPVNLDKLFYSGDMSQNMEVRDGDTIFVPEATMNKFSVVGQVQRQGQYRWKKNTTVFDAISTAGGATERAKLKSTFVLRGDSKSPQKIQLDLDKYMKKADLSQNIQLQPGDVVYVAETSKPDWNSIGKILSSIVSGSYLFRILD